MTVSLALRGSPNVARTTHDTLRALAEEMGYRPNPLIVANMTLLRAKRRAGYSGTLAYIGTTSRPLPPSDMQGRMYLGAKRRAEMLGYRLEWSATDPEDCSGRRLTEILHARGILGVVLAANCWLPPESHLDWSKFAIAAIGRTEIGHPLHRTAGDAYRAVCETCEICRSRNYRRIGLALSREHHRAHRGLHRAAFLGCQAEWSGRDRVPVLITDEWEQAPFLTWQRRHRPDVVIAWEDSPLKWLASAKLRVPQDIGLVRPHINNETYGIAGFLFNDADLGAAAIDLVAEQLMHNERGLPDVAKYVLLRGRWCEGASLRPALGGTNAVTTDRVPAK